MDNIVHKKNEALQNLRNSINDLVYGLSTNSLVNKIKIISTVPNCNIMPKIDALILQEILDDNAVYDLKSLILLFNEYSVENNVNMQLNILNVIIDNYINESLNLNEASALMDILDDNSFNDTIKLKFLSKLVEHNIISYFGDYLKSNIDSFTYPYPLAYNDWETIALSKNLLIINNELKLNIDEDKLFSIINDLLNDISMLETSVLIDLHLIYFIYDVDTSVLNKFNIEKYVPDEDNVLINDIKVYLKDEASTQNTLENLMYKFTYINKNLISNVIQIKNQSFLKKQSDLKKQIVEVIHVLNEEIEICPICNNELNKQEVWLAFYTDKTQEKYNGVVPATTLFCRHCNKHYSEKDWIKAMEDEIYPEILFCSSF